MEQLHALTPGLYMTYKRRRYSEVKIAKLHNVSPPTLLQWRRENGLPLNMNVARWDVYAHYFPEEVERMKNKYMKYHDQGWTAEACGEAVGLSPNQTDTFRKYFLPELVLYKPRHIYTEAELALVKKNRLNTKLVSNRVAEGWTLEDALNTPPIKRTFTKREKRLMEEHGLKSETVSRRISSGWDKKRALTTPPQKYYFTEEELAIMQENGLEQKVVQSRIYQGWTKQRAMTEPVNEKRRKAGIINANKRLLQTSV